MIKIAICDDNKQVCKEIEDMLLEHNNISDVRMDIEVFCSGESLIEFIKNEHPFDLIFLDIELGSTTGIEVGKTIRGDLDDQFSKIVFITAKNGYEQKLFDYQPLNFIKKPISKVKLLGCLNLAIRLLNIGEGTFVYKKGYDLFRVGIKEILYFEVNRKKVKIVTIKEDDEFYDTLENVKSKLPSTFIEPHNSFLINFNMVSSITKDEIIMTNGKIIPVSRRHLNDVRNLLIKLEEEKRSVSV